MATSENAKPEGRRKAEDELFTRQRNYQALFADSPVATWVLEDLAKFCRAHESTFNADPRIHALQEGRREVFLRITEHLNLPTQKLWELYTGTKF